MPLVIVLSTIIVLLQKEEDCVAHNEALFEECISEIEQLESSILEMEVVFEGLTLHVPDPQVRISQLEKHKVEFERLKEELRKINWCEGTTFPLELEQEIQEQIETLEQYYTHYLNEHPTDYRNAKSTW